MEEKYVKIKKISKEKGIRRNLKGNEEAPAGNRKKEEQKRMIRYG